MKIWELLHPVAVHCEQTVSVLQYFVAPNPNVINVFTLPDSISQVPGTAFGLYRSVTKKRKERGTMRKLSLIIVSVLLTLLTFCESNVNGPRDQDPIDPGPVNASLNIGSDFLAESSEDFADGKLIVMENFAEAPVSGDLTGAFEGNISAELGMKTRNGSHKGTGVLDLFNGTKFEVELQGNTVDGKDAGYLIGYDTSNRYRIRAKYMEVNGSSRGDQNRPLLIQGSIEDIQYDEFARY